MSDLHLILGGARSGKSRLAEQTAETRHQRLGKTLLYIATATADDKEMQTRILHHQQTRDQKWQLIEEPLNLAKVIDEYNDVNRCLLIDCLTLWLTNCLCLHGVDFFLEQKEHFIAALKRTSASVILVSNEVGHGIVPMGELSRQFVDHSGWLHQEIAAFANRVDFVIAGLTQTLKGDIK